MALRQGTNPEVPQQQPLGPPDLVDHRPNASQPELVSDISVSEQSPGQYGPPDLTSPGHVSLVSHDQHYEFYNQAYSNNHTQGNIKKGEVNL